VSFLRGWRATVGTFKKGWGHEYNDYIKHIRNMMVQSVGHYHPTVQFQNVTAELVPTQEMEVEDKSDYKHPIKKTFCHEGGCDAHTPIEGNK